MNTNRQWLLRTRPEGMVGEQNFDYVESPSRPLKKQSLQIRKWCPLVYLGREAGSDHQPGWERAADRTGAGG